MLEVSVVLVICIIGLAAATAGLIYVLKQP
jgi:hypothetical protein